MKTKNEKNINIVTKRWVPTIRLKKKLVKKIFFFFEEPSIALIRKNRVSNINEKPKKLGFPPQAIISEYPSKKTKNHAPSNAVKLSDNFLKRRKNGMAIIENKREATIFKAIKVSVILKKASSKMKYKGLYRSPNPLKSYP